jgi:hypothetical protein
VVLLVPHVSSAPTVRNPGPPPFTHLASAEPAEHHVHATRVTPTAFHLFVGFGLADARWPSPRIANHRRLRLRTFKPGGLQRPGWGYLYPLWLSRHVVSGPVSRSVLSLRISFYAFVTKSMFPVACLPCRLIPFSHPVYSGPPSSIPQAMDAG